MTTTDKNGYKVLIPAAGTGSRLGKLTKFINKALVDIEGKPAISRIIDMFPYNCVFVIALGYKGNLIKQFLSLAYPNRKFYYTYVDKYEGEGSGLGLTILSAEKYLREPFVFCSCDTIIEGEIPFPDKNIAGYCKRKNINQYRTLNIDNDKVLEILEKGNTGNKTVPYIGFACINDWKIFWKEMHNGNKEAIEKGESYPLKFFAKKNILYAKEFNWFDTGNTDELKKTRMHFKKPDSPNILPKPDEAVWFIDNKVIKFSNDTKFIKERVERASYLKNFVPKIISHTDNMYMYKKEEGEVLSKINDITIFKKLLDYSKNFWQQVEEPNGFNEICKEFYYQKTHQRIELYYKTFKEVDNEKTVNGCKLPKLCTILDEIDWKNIISGSASRFHGDFHFENILYDKKSDKFTFLDWRQNFGGLKKCGDIYYDLAKLLHGLIVCHELIAQNKFSVEIAEKEVSFSLERKNILVDCENYYYKWLELNGYDVKKVKIITALIYLNIAPLHHNPYCHFLYYLGKKMLYDNLRFNSHTNNLIYIHL